MSLEQVEHHVMNEVAGRLTRVSDPTPSMAILTVEAALNNARTADLEDPEAWLSIATVAAKQAVIATWLKERAL